MISKDEKLKSEKEAFINAFKDIDNLPLGNTIPQVRLLDEDRIGELFDTILYNVHIDFSQYFGVEDNGYELSLEAVAILLMLDCKESIKKLCLHMKREELIPLAIKYGAVNSFKAIANFVKPCEDATSYLVQVCKAFDAILKDNSYLTCSQEDLLDLIKKYKEIVIFLNQKGANSSYTSETIRGMTISEYAKFIQKRESNPTILELMAKVDENASLLKKGILPFESMKAQDEVDINDNKETAKAYEILNDFGIFSIKSRANIEPSMNSNSFATEESSGEVVFEEEIFLLMAGEEEQVEEQESEDIFRLSLH